MASPSAIFPAIFLADPKISVFRQKIISALISLADWLSLLLKN